MTVFCDVTLCSLIYIDRHYRDYVCLHHQGATSQKRAIFILLVAVRDWNLTRIIFGEEHKFCFTQREYFSTRLQIMKLVIMYFFFHLYAPSSVSDRNIILVTLIPNNLYLCSCFRKISYRNILYFMHMEQRRVLSLGAETHLLQSRWAPLCIENCNSMPYKSYLLPARANQKKNGRPACLSSGIFN
jgi:hypothetical protein